MTSGAAPSGRTLVTGATGFIGRAVMSRLGLAGFDALGTTRRRVVPGHRFVQVPDIGPDTEWSDVLGGVRTVVHLAARVHVGDSGADSLTAHRQVNRDGTIRLSAAAARAGVSTFIFVSSIAAVCQHSDAPVDESTPCAPRSPYGISKYEAEQALLSQPSGMRLVIVRPPMVYGAGAPGNFGRLVRLIRTGLPLPLGAMNNARSFVAVDNLADALVVAAGDVRAAGIYHVADDQPLSTPELVRLIADATNSRAHLVRVPPRLLRAGARLIGASDAIERLISSLPVDSGRFRRAVGWQQPLTTVEAFRAYLQ